MFVRSQTRGERAGRQPPDLQFYVGRGLDQPDRFVTITVSLVRPRSRGEVRLRSANPADAPLHSRQLPARAGATWRRSLEGVRLARALGNAAAYDKLRADEIEPGPPASADPALSRVRAARGRHDLSPRRHLPHGHRQPRRRRCAAARARRRGAAHRRRVGHAGGRQRDHARGVRDDRRARGRLGALGRAWRGGLPGKPGHFAYPEGGASRRRPRFARRAGCAGGRPLAERRASRGAENSPPASGRRERPAPGPPSPGPRSPVPGLAPGPGPRPLCSNGSMRFVAIVFCLLAVAACDENVTGPTVPLNTEFVVAPGETRRGRGRVGDRALRSRDRRFALSRGCGLHPGWRRRRAADRDGDGGSRGYELHTGDMQPVQA